MQAFVGLRKMGVCWIVFMQLMCGAVALRSLHPFSGARIPTSGISLKNTQLQTTTRWMLTTMDDSCDNLEKMGKHILNCVNNDGRGDRFQIDGCVENRLGGSLGGKIRHLLRKSATHLQQVRCTIQKFVKRLYSLIANLSIFFCHMNIFNNVAIRSVGLPVAAMVMAPEGALASSFIKYSNLKSTQKLSTTPVFYLSNSGGSPYLQEDVQVKSGVIVYNQP